MKTIIASLVFAFASVIAIAQSETKNEIATAIKEGNSIQLAEHFMPSVDLTVGSAEDVYSKDQAEMILKRFFEDHEAVDFKLKHEGKSKLDDFYYIGTLKTNKGEFRLTYFLKKSEDIFMIKQFRIEENP
ncbi:MAG: DUF4783 domain-containing protein [Bacteroidota bacterium]